MHYPKAVCRPALEMGSIGGTVLTPCSRVYNEFYSENLSINIHSIATFSTTRFNSNKLYILPTECIYVFCMFFRTYSNFCLKQS